MRVTINHREESAGLTGGTKHHFVDCSVEFSEEEKAIIKARDLKNTNFIVPSAAPLPTQAAYMGSGIFNSLGRLGVFGGFILGIISALTPHSPLGSIAGMMMFFGAILWAWAAFTGRRQNKAIENPDQVIRLGDLLSRGSFTCHAANPACAKSIEDDIKENLASVKQIIRDSAELQTTSTFEL